MVGLIDVAKQNIAVDPGLDLLSLATQAPSLTSGNITFTTLPVKRFGKDPLGEDVNIVDVAGVRARPLQASSIPHPRPRAHLHHRRAHRP